MLELREGSKSYRGADGDVIALRACSMTLQPGAFIAVMGRSGSGKSTLMRLLAGIETPDTGTLLLDGSPVADRAARTGLRRGIVACIYQDLNLVPELTLGENIALAQRLCRQHPLSADEALERVGVGGLARRRPHQASGGQQQRAAIARALAVGAHYILADEPTGALDEDNALLVAEAFQQAASDGTAVLAMTHDNLLASAAEDIWRLRDGELLCSA